MIKSNIPFFFAENCNIGSKIILSPEESKHAIKSLRLKKADKIMITDGKGNVFECIITNTDFNNTEVEIKASFTINPLPYYLHIACAFTQHSERFEWFVEKAIEFGVSEITPIITKRTEKRSIRTERLQKIAISTIKQSRQAHLPKINHAINYSDFIKSSISVNKGIATCTGNRYNFKHWIEKNFKNEYLILIGPEGDFTDDEVKLALENKYTLLNLGNSILRTETAAIYITAIFRILKQK